ncbi:hypothetical protein C8J57DRAFT_1397547 [Mycena rebaudengoi]|nr:hypothetical protein C8J57DRAFT_1397547 [Mycena rebaudengoi]
MPSLPTFGATTTAEEVADVFANEIKGKNVLITGTSLNGIGFETARVIAKYANLVIITGYNDERSEDITTGPFYWTDQSVFTSANIRRLTLDLSSLAAVRKSAAEVNAYPEPIHVLIHNAAAPVAPFKLTADNLELQIATGHIGPFLFAKLIAPKILDTKTAKITPRVVVVASDAHKLFNAHGVDLEFFEKPEASNLSKRSKGKLGAYSLHPGLIMTNINLADFMGQLLRLVDKEGNTVNNWFGTWKTHYIPGAYLVDGVDASAGVPQHSSDPVIAKKLWEVTEKIIGEKFIF